LALKDQPTIGNVSLGFLVAFGPRAHGQHPLDPTTRVIDCMRVKTA
jgi:hypothetical protein